MTSKTTASNYDLLKQAIINRLQVVAEYNGYKREMCPTTLGSKGGRAHCLFYQFGGESSSGAILSGSDKNWRCIPIDMLSIIELKEGTWHAGHNHSRRQTCVENVHF